MKVGIAVVASIVLVGSGVAAYALTAQSDPDTKKWEEFATPSEGHKFLEAKLGRWNLKLKMTRAPGAPPSESVATSELKWTMDGRFVEERTEGTCMGRPFHGFGLFGYDNLKKKYVGTWVDSLGTGITPLEGTYDGSSKSFSYVSSVPDLKAGRYTTGRTVDKMIDKDHWTMTTYVPGERNREYVSLEIEYTRAD